MHNEVWVYTEILPLTVPYIRAKASSLLYHVFVAAILERSSERALNLGITGVLWNTFGSLPSSPSSSRVVSIESLAIVYELEAIQAIVIVPIIRIVSAVSVVFPYDRLDRLVLF